MKNSTKIVLLITFIILTSAFASAEMIIQTYAVDYGFMLQTTPVSSYELCQCESYTDYFIVENTGTYASTYTITTNSEYVALSATSFELLPNQSMTVYMFIQGACGKRINEDVVVSVTDLFRNTQELTKHLTVDKCQNLQAELRTENNGTSNPCTPITYNITVENTGVFTENYHVEFGGNAYADYFDIPYQDMTIGAGQKGTVHATITPACSISGVIDVPFTVEAENNDLIAYLSHQVTILDNYDFEVSAGETQACSLQTSQIPVVITNKANFENDYTIELKAPKNFALSTQTIRVDAESSAVFYVEVTPEQKQTGKQDMTITVTDETAKRKASVTTSVDVVACNGVSVNVGLQEDIYDCSGKHYYPILLKNTGLVDEDIRVDVYGSEYITAKESDFTLAAGEETEIVLVANVPPAQALEKDIQVVATVLGVNGITAEDSIHVHYLDEQACFEVALLTQKTKMNFDENEVSLILKNVGLDGAKYNFTYEGEGFSVADNTSSLQLGAGEEATIVLNKNNESEQRIYKGTLQAVTRSADDERTLVYLLPITINFHKESIFEKGTKYFSAEPCQFVSAVLLLLFIVGLLILIIRPDRARRNGIPTFMILLGIWILLAVVFIGIYGVPQLYEPVKASDDPLVINMAEDSTYMLNLGQFFIDEDGDTLDYLISEMDNVSVYISNGTAYFTPDENFFGSRRFRITAFDGNGGSTESPRMKLEVIDRPEYSGWTWYLHFCGYINVGLLLLVFFVAAMVFRPREGVSSGKKEVKTEEEKAVMVKKDPERAHKTDKEKTKKVAVKKVAKKKTAKKKVTSKKPSLPKKKKVAKE